MHQTPLPAGTALRRWLPFAGLIFFAASTPVAASSILVNGSFEQTLNMPSNGELVAGSTALTGWTISGTSTANNVVDWLGPAGGGSGFVASDGLYALDLDGRDALGGTVAQTFATSVGEAYLLAFDLSGNPGDSPTNGLPRVKTLRVSIAGLTQDYTFDSTGLTPSTLVWQPQQLAFAAIDTSTTVAFTSLTGAANSYGPMLDNVRVTPTPVPEPATWCLFLSGLGLVGATARTCVTRSVPAVRTKAGDDATR